MGYYRRVGNVPPKCHTQHRAPSGALYYEELVGEDGFSAESSLLYHRGIPSAITGAAEWNIPDGGVVANAPLLPRHLRPHELIEGEEWKRHDVVTGRRMLLGNADLQIYYAAAGEVSPLYRDAVSAQVIPRVEALRAHVIPRAALT